MRSHGGSSGDLVSHERLEQRPNTAKVGGSNPSPRTRPWIEWRNPLGWPECPYLIRWLIDVRWFSIRLHHWRASDDARHHHDHPWWFLTFVLSGSYDDVGPEVTDHVKAGQWRFRPALHQHSVIVDKDGAWTILITGPAFRKFGFWVNGKFKKANKYFLEHQHHPCEV